MPCSRLEACIKGAWRATLGRAPGQSRYPVTYEGHLQQGEGAQRMSSRFIFQSHRASLGVLVLLSLLSMSIALADDESDPPGRVARLSYANGAVSMQPAGV